MDVVVLYILIGILLGIVVAAVWLKLRGAGPAQESAVLTTQLEAEKQHSARLEQQLAELKHESQARQEQITQLKSESARLETQLNAERKQSDEKLKLLENDIRWGYSSF